MSDNIVKDNQRIYEAGSTREDRRFGDQITVRIEEPALRDR